MSTIAPQFQQYTRRILALLGDQDPLKVQQAAVRKLRRAIRGLSKRQLGWNPVPGKWSIAQIIAHLADTELVYGYRIRKILSEPGCPIEAYNQDVWAKNLEYPKHTLGKDLNYLEAMRAMNLEFYKRLSPEERRRHGIHTERGKESIEHICKMIAGHDLNHLGQIEAIRGRLAEKR